MWQKFDTEGIVHREFVPPGQTVNGNVYCDVLRREKGNIRRKLPDERRNISWTLHRDKAPAHASLVMRRQFLASKNTTVIPHPPYSPDLAPPVIFFLFPKMKLKLNGRRFGTIEEMQTGIAGRDEDADTK